MLCDHLSTDFNSGLELLIISTGLLLGIILITTKKFQTSHTASNLLLLNHFELKFFLMSCLLLIHCLNAIIIVHLAVINAIKSVHHYIGSLAHHLHFCTILLITLCNKLSTQHHWVSHLN